ncbi:AarF/ABC1/UbiB kinase family protein [Aliiglaciecola sp. LCG003]|uniref:ABC1 kinase family protein n=1 Tax=Aliiglaciecola sp. LCG003 TaxID=3053655 RepID=UPI002572A262|nr:AarF/ABC1/UbiB kinase family protein [Aliiglaciecola sp. LCG003]WJG09653.1 AarF/ABC1/UbiB kinase family protein [Aliiglaciecola sp. LCG003]
MVKKFSSQEAKIPKGRISRFTKLGSMASRIAGNMISEGISELSKGNRPKVKDLLLTPGNIMRVAEQLAQMRGAAMKIGQLISMDAGDVLPPELSEILSRLRSEAKSMPQSELLELLNAQWGEKWQQQFIQFPMQPIAAASIGQVHKVISTELQRLAIKIQYPGIKQSIDSDVDNVASLIKLSGMLPKDIDIKPLLKEAKAQLHDEADYLLEGKRLEQYAEIVVDDPAFSIPTYVAKYSNEVILAMTYMDGQPIESLINAEQGLRDQVVSDLLRLLFKELFDYQLVQTDPNFANYQYDAESHKIVLLDFGATREFPLNIAQGYLNLMRGGFKSDLDAVADAADKLGLLKQSLPPSVKNIIYTMCYQACEPLYTHGPFNFGDTDLIERLRVEGMRLGFDKEYAHTPPIDAIFLHRKLAGLFLLATKLKANVDVRSLFVAYIDKVIVSQP